MHDAAEPNPHSASRCVLVTPATSPAACAVIEALLARPGWSVVAHEAPPPRSPLGDWIRHPRVAYLCIPPSEATMARVLQDFPVDAIVEFSEGVPASPPAIDPPSIGGWAAACCSVNSPNRPRLVRVSFDTNGDADLTTERIMARLSDET